MFLSDVAIRRPVFTAMLSMALIVFGLLGYRQLPVDQYPPVEFPMVLVQTIYPGATPEDIERDVTTPLEDALASTPGLKQLQSWTRDNASTILVQFEMGTPLTDAMSTLRDRVSRAQKELPSSIDPPEIRQIDIGALPVLVLTLSAPGGIDATRRLADDKLRPLLEQVDGVGSVNVLGGRDREVHVDLDLDRLAALRISPTDVSQRLGYENLSLPVGQFDTQGFTVGVRAEGAFRNVEDLRQAVVSMTPDGRQVRLHEVASVYDGHALMTRKVRFNGEEAVSLEVVKRSGANTVEVAHGVRAALDKHLPTLGKDVRYDIISDQSLDVEANAHEVWIAIWFGGAMAVLVILFFLLDVRGTLISATALPTSVIGTFALMAALGFSINTMTLLGLSLAIGLLIDDAVVVREAITQRLEAGDSPEVAAARGTREIALAVLATTLSLVAVFVPVAFMTGIVGQFFKQFGITIAAAVLLSLFVAFTLDPMLSARFSRAVTHHGPRTGLAGAIERFLNALDARYRGILDAALRFRGTTALATVAVLVATVALGSRIPVEFVPKEDRGEVIADLRLPIGSSLESTESWSRAAEGQIAALPGVTRVYSVIGNENTPHLTRFRVKVVPKAERTEPLSHYQDAVRGILTTTPGAEVTLSEPGVIEGLGDWPPLMVVLQGNDMDELLRASQRVQASLDAIPGTSDVRLTHAPGRPELHLDIDRAVAADRGVPAGLVASTARMLVDGAIIGSLRDGGEEADIRVRAAPAFARDAGAIAALPLPSPRGLLSIGEVANVSMQVGSSEIQHTDRMRSITVSTQLGEGAALGAIVEALRADLANNPLPESIQYKISGQAEDMEATAAAMGLAVAIALACIFMVLASQFESLIHPITLLMSVPLAMVGAVLALFITGKSFSMGSQIGFILLMGLVTKNAILLVDGALQAMRDGMSPGDAIRSAGPKRLRPILMTSAAMAFGMIPTAIGTGVGAEFRAPMAVAVIGGVISSTILTLLVVPVVFLWIEEQRSRLAALWKRTEPAPVLHEVNSASARR
jgi:HAE1 family hydrophobic/amphiphilic exporter-1